MFKLLESIPTLLEAAGSFIASVRGAVTIFGKVCIVAAVWFASEMGQLWDLAGRNTLPQIDLSATEVDTSAKQKSTFESFRVISSRNIFKAKSEQSTQAPQTAEPVSKLDLRLVGTNVGASSTPFAIIEDKKKKSQEIFDLNDMVFDQAKLIEVLPESVKIERSGEIEVLLLEGGEPGSGAKSGSGIEAIDDDETEFSVEESELNDALANLPRLLSQARAVPYFRNGRSIGMRLFAIRRGSLYEKLGLKNGDIIRSVNENSLTDPAQALKLFEQLKDERSIGVKLERGGAERSMSYSIR